MSLLSPSYPGNDPKGPSIITVFYFQSQTDGLLVKWFSGINGNCSIIANSNFFVVRVWEGCGDSSQCVPADIDPDTWHHHPSIYCKDYVYNGGELNSTEDCQREIGRGSAVVESGSCEFYDGNDCVGSPFLGLKEGVCDEQIYITNFTCVSNSLFAQIFYLSDRETLYQHA